MRHTGGQLSLCALVSEVRIFGDAKFRHKPIDHQNGGRGTVAVCMRARG